MRIGERLKRLIIAAAAIGAASLAGAQAASTVIAGENPVLASQISTSSTKGNEMAAGALFQAGQIEQSRPFAERALRIDPLSDRSLGVVGQGIQTGPKRDQFMQAAESVTKRGTLLQGTLLQYHADNDDIEGSLRIIDRVVRVYPRLLAPMTQQMAQALDRPATVPIFRNLLIQNPPWKDAFLQSAAERPEALAQLVELRRSLPQKIELEKQTDAAIMRALLSNGQMRSAMSIYQQLANRAEMSSGELGWSTQYPPFDWTLSDEAGEYLRPIAEGSGAAVRIRSGRGGVLGRRLIATERPLSGVKIEHDLALPKRDGALTAALACFGSEDTVVRMSITASPTIVLVPQRPACATYELILEGRAFSTEPDIDGTISHIAIF